MSFSITGLYSSSLPFLYFFILLKVGEKIKLKKWFFNKNIIFKFQTHFINFSLVLCLPRRGDWPNYDSFVEKEREGQLKLTLTI